MFDMWFGDIELTRLTIIASVVILLPVQLLLCFKVKNLAIRLTPVIILSILMALFIVRWLSAVGWDGLFYAFFAVFVGLMILMCGIGWGIWAVVHGLKKKRSKEL